MKMYRLNPPIDVAVGDSGARLKLVSARADRQVGRVVLETDRRRVVDELRLGSQRDRERFCREIAVQAPLMKSWRVVIANIIGMMAELLATLPPEQFTDLADEFDRPPAAADTAHVTPLNAVTPKPIDWLWPGYLPLGKLTLLDGNPGVGKSTLTADWAARVSRGRPFPGEPPTATRQPAGVLLLAEEDDLADTLAPRLDAADADRSRIAALNAVSDTQGSRPPRLPDDLPLIEQTIVRFGARLIVIDPLVSYLPSDTVDVYRDQDIRQVLNQLRAVAERQHVCIVLVRHLNKASDLDAIYRGGGSIGIIGLARAGYLVAPDPTDSSGQRRALACLKLNVGQMPPTWLYRIDAAASGVGRLEWLATSPLTANQLCRPAAPPADATEAAGDDPEPTQLDRAVEFLRAELANGPRRSADVVSAAQASGIHESALNRARQLLGVRARRCAENHRRWWLALPALTTSPAAAAPPGQLPLAASADAST